MSRQVLDANVAPKGERFEAAWRLALFGLFGNPVLGHAADVVHDLAFQDRFVRAARDAWPSAFREYATGRKRTRAPRHHARDIMLTYWVLRGRSYSAAARLFGAEMRLRDDERLAGVEWDAFQHRGSLDERDHSAEAREARATVGNLHLVRALRMEGETDDATVTKQSVQEQVSRLIAKALAVSWTEVATWSKSDLPRMLRLLRVVEEPDRDPEDRDAALLELQGWTVQRAKP